MLTKNKNINGFSLIELSIALVLVGLFMATMLNTYTTYRQVTALNATKGAGEPAERALSRFLVKNGRLPCPGDPAAIATDPAQAGIEQCATLVALAVDSCSGVNGGDGLCRVNGTRDAENNADPADDEVFIGSLPYVTLGMNMKDTYDGWDRQLGYAVTARLAADPPEDPLPKGKGTIAVREEDTIGGIPRTDTQQIICKAENDKNKGTCDLLVWSYGSSHRGAYTSSGHKTVDCDDVVGLDEENCNGDAIFIKADRALQPGAGFYDGYLLITDLRAFTETFWKRDTVDSISVAEGAAGTVNVGIGTRTPQAALEIYGNMQAAEVHADVYCENEGNYCFKTILVGADDQNQGATCGREGTSEPVVPVFGWKDGRIHCPVQTPPGFVPPTTCASGEFVTGVDLASGGLICSPKP